MTRVVLASRSPRRTDLLTMLGIPHRVSPSSVPEAALPGESPDAQVARLAAAKAGAVFARTRGDVLVIGADTLVAVEGRVLGQPSGEADARRMLRELSGRTHTVYTGLHLLRRGRDPASGIAESLVTFHPLTPEQIAWYVSTGEPMDKAGAYAAQGVGAVFLARIEGSFHNVVGFPVDLFASMLPAMGTSLADLREGEPG